MVLWFIFCFTDFFSQQVRVGGRNKNKNKIHSDHFPIELKSKETWNCVSFDFNSFGKFRINFIFILPIKMANISPGAVTGGNLINLAAVEKTK